MLGPQSVYTLSWKLVAAAQSELSAMPSHAVNCRKLAHGEGALRYIIGCMFSYIASFILNFLINGTTSSLYAALPEHVQALTINLYVERSSAHVMHAFIVTLQ